MKIAIILKNVFGSIVVYFLRVFFFFMIIDVKTILPRYFNVVRISVEEIKQ